jgi:hyaluronoglucosaminidase
VPDVNNNGLVIIDFESWRPIFRQNWAALAPYKDVSYQIEKERHPLWPQKWREDEASKHSIVMWGEEDYHLSHFQAEQRFEASGREYVEQTIKLSRKLRPKAHWGYYAFPYCFQKGSEKECPGNVRAENNR